MDLKHSMQGQSKQQQEPTVRNPLKEERKVLKPSKQIESSSTSEPEPSRHYVELSDSPSPKAIPEGPPRKQKVRLSPKRSQFRSSYAHVKTPIRHEQTNEHGDPEIIYEISRKKNANGSDSVSCFKVGQYRDKMQVHWREFEDYNKGEGKKLYPLKNGFNMPYECFQKLFQMIEQDVPKLAVPQTQKRASKKQIKKQDQSSDDGTSF